MNMRRFYTGAKVHMNWIYDKQTPLWNSVDNISFH